MPAALQQRCALRGAALSAACARRSVASRRPQDAPRAAADTKPARPRLILLRHGAAESETSLQDHQRPLTAEGRVAVTQLAARLREADCLPQIILCSDTVRSRETVVALRTAEPAFAAADTRFLGSLYVAAAMDGETATHLREQVLVALGAAAAACHTVMCVGHNRGWEEAASELSGQAVELKTANACVLEARQDEGGWAAALAQAGPAWELRALLTPA